MENESANYSVYEKWGEAADAGFSQIPDVLLKAQNTLGISATEMVVLFNINAAWWRAEQMPFPSAAGISRRMGVSARTVERAINSLAKKGLLKKNPIDGRKGRRNLYDLSPLTEILSKLGSKDPYYLAKKEKNNG